MNDYAALRTLFGKLLAEIQRIKSEGDYEAARSLVETYAVKVDPVLHKELLERYARLNVAPYKGFIAARLSRFALASNLYRVSLCPCRHMLVYPVDLLAPCCLS